MTNRPDSLFPLRYTDEFPSLRSAWGRVDIHSLASFWVNQSRVEGPYLEFGVASGRSAVSAIRASRFYGDPAPSEYFLFDSFQGLPALKGIDEGSNQFAQGDFAYTKAQVIENLRHHEVYDEARVHLVEGFFEESLTRFRLEDYHYRSASIVHIDVDLYSSCKIVLDAVGAYLQQGTVVLFDDWNCFGASNRRGERKAAFDWLIENPKVIFNEYASYGWHGKAFIVDRAAE